MVFKRRTPRTRMEWLRAHVYPRGGFRRTGRYVSHRLRRLPDKPHRIARGVFAGVFVAFTPLFGVHFLGAAALAWVLRGNIIAALLASFVGNPLTLPLIAVASIETGHWLLGIETPLNFASVASAFGNAGAELWDNAAAVFTAEPAHWGELGTFFHDVYLPYLVGGLLPGLAFGLLSYWGTIPLVRAYQRIRVNRLRDGRERRRAGKAQAAAAIVAIGGESGDDAGRAAP